MERSGTAAMVDFRTVYFNGRVLLQHGDPYQDSGAHRIFMMENHTPYPPHGPSEMTNVYPPTMLLVTFPIAFLPWAIAQRFWAALIAAGLILAGYLMFDIGAEYAPVLSGALIGFVLSNSGSLIYQGNVAGVAVSLCVIAIWCFDRQRFVALGVACLAISLAIKPHDSGLVWLFLLLLGGVHGKRALQTLAVIAVLGVITIVWVSHVAPHWARELGTNVVSSETRGSGNDPGPDSLSNTVVSRDINAQTLFSVLDDEPRFYNPMSYILCGSLFITLIFGTLRVRLDRTHFWMAMAAVSALSMLPLYHRHHDAKLLLLAAPACAMLWSQRNLVGRLAGAVTGLVAVSIADVPRAILTAVEAPWHLTCRDFSGKMWTVLVARPVPLSLLGMVIFYLWVYPSRPSVIGLLRTDPAGDRMRVHRTT